MPLTPAQATYVDDFIRTGHADAVLAPWPGNIIESGQAAHHALRTALVAEIRRRETSARLPDAPSPDELRALTDIANLYLASIDADLLGPDAPDLVGMSQETTCFVPAAYLDGRGEFDDFVVHEAAHIFHNWKREYAGLPHTRYREWLLPIAFRKREYRAASMGGGPVDSTDAEQLEPESEDRAEVWLRPYLAWLGGNRCLPA